MGDFNPPPMNVWHPPPIEGVGVRWTPLPKTEAPTEPAGETRGTSTFVIKPKRGYFIMEYSMNEGKRVEIEVDGKLYKRRAIKTHFVKQGESYIDIMNKYVVPGYSEGDFISISEKIIALCQNRVVKREDIKIGFWAKFLSKFASHPDTGVGVGETIKMQYAIDNVGLPKVLWASFCSAVTKPFGKRGVFYEIVGEEVSGLDGFYDHVWSEYRDIGIEMPANPKGVCNEIKEKCGVSCMLVDANDLGQEILGFSDDLKGIEAHLKEFIKDNPAGQGQETTPIILMHPVGSAEE